MRSGHTAEQYLNRIYFRALILAFLGLTGFLMLSMLPNIFLKHMVFILYLFDAMILVAVILDALRQLDGLLAEHGYRGFMHAFGLDGLSNVDSWIKWMPW